MIGILAWFALRGNGSATSTGLTASFHDGDFVFS